MVIKNKKGNIIKNKYFLISIGIIIFFLILLSTPVIDIRAGKYDDFAKCVSGGGVKMYGAYWCAHCNNQKKLFGGSFSEINYIECSLPNNGGQTQECIGANIESYPTWEFGDGSREQGEISLDKLSQVTGCILPK
ncbi:MAG: hypothetical protein AABW83_04110 [Nanoarchaeota archaeon]